MSSPGLLTTRPAAIASVLALFNFNSYSAFVQARTALGECLRASMQNPGPAYSLVVDNLATPGEDPRNTVHPYNIAGALFVVCGSAAGWGDILPLQEDLMVYTGAWTPLSGVYIEPYPSIPGPPQEAIPAIPAAPSNVVPIAPAIIPAATAPAPVETALATAATQPLPAKILRNQPLAVAHIIEDRADGAGRPKMGPFEKAHAKREKLGTMPYWWEEFASKLPRLFVEPPYAVVDTEHAGPTPAMVYTTLLVTAELLLERVDGNLTVQELRDWISEVNTGIGNSPCSTTAFDIANAIYK